MYDFWRLPPSILVEVIDWVDISLKISQIEHSALQVDVYKALKKGSSIMKELNRRFTFEDVEKLRQETQEAIEYQEVGVRW